MYFDETAKLCLLENLKIFTTSDRFLLKIYFLKCPNLKLSLKTNPLKNYHLKIILPYKNLHIKIYIKILKTHFINNDLKNYDKFLYPITNDLFFQTLQN